MVLYNFDKVVRVKLLLPAGAANKNIQLRTIFNNHRSTFYESFVDQFNKKTENLPNDVLIRTVVYMPLPGSNSTSCTFEVLGPSLYQLFCKFNFLNVYSMTGLTFFKVNLFDLHKIILFKKSLTDLFSFLSTSQIIRMVLGSFFSYSVNKKYFLFLIKYLRGFKFTYYNVKFFNPFYKYFFSV